jgi:hypothetical protein
MKKDLFLLTVKIRKEVGRWKLEDRKQRIEQRKKNADSR